MQIDAVYENGVLRPLQPLDLAEHEHVVLSVSRTSSDRSAPATEYVESLRRDVRDSEAAPGIEEVRRCLSRIPGSMADEIIARRGDR